MYNRISNHLYNVGKTASCGAIALYCLNLPLHLRYRPENIFLVGFTPPPKTPTHETLCHLLNPVMTVLATYGVAPGKLLPIFNNAQWVPVEVKIAPLISDSPARAEVGGFLGHAAIQLCSFCSCTKDDIENLDMSSWTLRTGAQVRLQADEWRKLTTKVAREAHSKETGVRWSSLHMLPYYNPVKHMVLGFMHNWLEGVLSEHLRIFWGIGRDQEHEKQAKEIEKDEQWETTDLDESADELQDILQDSADFGDEEVPSSPESSHFSRYRTRSNASSSHTESSTTPTPNFPHNPFDVEDDPNDPDFNETDNTVPFTMDDAQLQVIRNCIQNVSLPTWVSRPPGNLGKASHGKLKAQEFLTLFTVIFPLVIPELWHFPSASEMERKHFQCFSSLVIATNIICSFKTSSADADMYTHYYVRYREIVQQIYAHWPSKPNHHWAMHNATMLKYWGPLASLSEFAGERLNGMLQKIKTNKQLRELLLCK